MNISKIESYLTSAEIESAHRCATRLILSLPNKVKMNNNRVLLGYGGGKDSSYTVAWVRYIQHIVSRRMNGQTFQLRIVTNRHAGMNSQVMENIDRAYNALNIYGDPTVECLLADDLMIRPFQSFLPLPDSVLRRNRTDVLMNGHRFRADARSTFCNACNLSMVNSFSCASHFNGGVDIIITGDSPKEQLAYFAWVRQLSRLFKTPSGGGRGGFSEFLKTLDGVSHSYFSALYGTANVKPEHRIFHDLARKPVFFNIYEDTAYESGEHWEMLCDYLGFKFDRLMFSFSESDCGNPTLMAHIRGLRAESLLNRTYAEGVNEYVVFALNLMKKKGFPKHLIEQMARRYEDEDALDEARKCAEQFALDAFNLTTQQLVCMIFSPFADQGAHLERYLTSGYGIDYSSTAIHAFLATPLSLNLELSRQLESCSGLSIDLIRQCYKNPIATSLLENSLNDPMASVLRRDPHKMIIKVKHGPDQNLVDEVISGR